MHVVVTKYNKSWSKMFDEESLRIKRIFGDTHNPKIETATAKGRDTTVLAAAIPKFLIGSL
ncbi:hypothetical protein D3P09_20975 [Paenibacillus pinisoli]|uniref:Uncharacterized protein n=1 Tax=Paenibacillus pinisoli TaxID=1276110 RepID=A0A3A6PU72_9BACL|nr:hypothetical protein D3P09_20975 [Paenibacillus pinisoli]